MSKHKKFVVLAGGLTGGPVIPLLAVAKEWQKNNEHIKPVLVDLKKSAGALIAQEHGIIFKHIITGKIRRYWAWQNLIAPILLLIGLVQSFLLLRKYKPIAVLGAGGFVQIPLIIAAWVLRIPRFIHQQDVYPTLSNQICSIFANLVTTTFEFSIRDFLQGSGLGKKYITTNKVIWTGNPFLEPEAKISKEDAIKHFRLHSELPVLLVFGGGGGSKAINEIIVKALPELTKVVQVIHGTGSGKHTEIKHKNYHPYAFIDDMAEAYTAADIVIGRAGITTLTELAQYKKPSIIIPMPETHQEYNARLLYEFKSAIVLDQREIDTESLIRTIRKILLDPELQKGMEQNMQALFPSDSAQKIYTLITDYIEKQYAKK